MRTRLRSVSVSASSATLCLGLLAAMPAGAQSPSSAPGSYPPLTQLWTAHGPAASKPMTWGPTVDPATGDVWVAAAWDSVYWIFGPDGAYKESWGTQGSGPGQFDFVTADTNPAPFGSVAFAPDGSFYVADVGNFRVQAFDKDRNFVREWGAFGTDDGQFARAWSIATDGTTVYVGDDTRMDIQAFDTNGTYLRTIPAPAPGFFTLDPSGRIVTVEPSADPAASTVGLSILDPVSGQQVGHYPIAVPGFYLGPTVDAAGDTFVNVVDPADYLHYLALVEFDPTGATIGIWSTAGGTVAVAPDDSAIYLAAEGWPDLRAYSLPKP